jgi:signal transduction histidine kinase
MNRLAIALLVAVASLAGCERSAATESAGVALAVTALLWVLNLLRRRHLKRQLDLRMRERVDERTRIARELHDTLLQSTQGLILLIQAAATRMAPEEPPRKQLEAALQLANDVVAEGRKRVLDLRIAGGQGDLRVILQDLADATGFNRKNPIRIGVGGAERRIHPVVLAEIRQIAGEALFNIARHAKARSVDVAIAFSRRELAIRIHDDGVGLSEDVRAAGSKPGHFGLVGMRERAERIGGALSVESHPGYGTDVTITLPAGVAFTD